MKFRVKATHLPLIALFGGILAGLMRLWLFAKGVDERGLLPVGNFSDVMSWIITALTLALLGYGCWNLRGGNKYALNFPASLQAAVGMAVAAVGFCISSIADLAAEPDSIGSFSALLGFLAAVAMLILAYNRYKGKRLSVLFHGVICVYLMVFLISHYRLWSASPQLQTYAFELLAIVFTMLSGYQRAAFDAGSGERRHYTFFSFAALFFCLATLPGSDNIAFFLGCAAWMYCTPCRLILPVRRDFE